MISKFGISIYMVEYLYGRVSLVSYLSGSPLWRSWTSWRSTTRGFVSRWKNKSSYGLHTYAVYAPYYEDHFDTKFGKIRHLWDPPEPSNQVTTKSWAWTWMLVYLEGHYQYVSSLYYRVIECPKDIWTTFRSIRSFLHGGQGSWKSWRSMEDLRAGTWSRKGPIDLKVV